MVWQPVSLQSVSEALLASAALGVHHLCADEFARAASWQLQRHRWYHGGPFPVPSKSQLG